jgi:hypothetical protein
MDTGALLVLLLLIPCALMVVIMLRGHRHGHDEKRARLRDGRAAERSVRWRPW